MKYDNISAAVFDEPWAITPAKAEAISALIELRMSGGKVDEADVQAVMAAAKMPDASAGKSVAVLPLFGVMAQHAGMMTRMSGGTSTSEFAADFKRAMKDPDIGVIVMHVDSPGGQVFGTAEAADLVYSARGVKPVLAAVNSTAASAAYWVSAQASKIYITTGGQVGSIGVITMHRDVSRAEENLGVKTTLLAMPARKIEGHPYGGLTPEAVATITERNQRSYDRFVAAVARGRGERAAAVKKGYGQGGMVDAEQAVAEGMADGVKTIDGVIEEALRMVGGRKAVRSSVAVAAARLKLAESE